MVQPAEALNGSVTYTFKAGSPGTYLYESGTDANKQKQMGMFGALVVRPAGHPDQANDRARLVLQHAATSTCSCSRRSTPTCTSRWSAVTPSTGRSTAPATS